MDRSKNPWLWALGIAGLYAFGHVFVAIASTSEPKDRIVFSAVQAFHRYQALHGNVGVAFMSPGRVNRAASDWTSPDQAYLALDNEWLSSADKPGIYVSVGHELGHILSRMGGSREAELVCDCIAGGFLERALPRYEADAAVDYLATLGDFAPNAQDSHGTPAERRRAAAQGRFLARTNARVDMVKACKEVVR